MTKLSILINIVFSLHRFRANDQEEILNKCILCRLKLLNL
jgi:hypothetical protein